MMSGIVRLALSRPYTFIVFAILISISGVFSIQRTPADIFPEIRIPVVAAVWTYAGMDPEEMAGRIVYLYERALSLTVNDIDHIESQSLPGYGIVKIFFGPKVDVSLATAQVTSISQTVLKFLPPGVTPPYVLNYNAATVPIVQLVLSGPISEQSLFDLGNNFMRPQLSTVPGSAVPAPFGGKVKLIMVDLDPKAMQSKGVSPADVSLALAEQNIITPAGTEKIGSFEYNIWLNDAPKDYHELSELPVKAVPSSSPVPRTTNSMILLRDVASVRFGFPPQINVVRTSGSRAVLMTILKSGAASTLDIVAGVKGLLPLLKQSLPEALHIDLVGDQTVFVKASISGVVREGIIAALLTSVMILLFLGSWRSTIIIALSIPLAILCSIVTLSSLGETLNIMTLGGLALAVGILVDDATVMIENINHHLEMGKSVRNAIIDGASQIVQPAFVSTFSICIVFIPMFFLKGIPHFLFVPMAKAVVFAMIASFILSQTFVPTMASLLFKDTQQNPPNPSLHQEFVMDPSHRDNRRKGIVGALVNFQKGFEHYFSIFRRSYAALLQTVVSMRGKFILPFMLVVIASLLILSPFLGRNFFPDVDAGQIKIHVRAQVGTRVDITAGIFDRVENTVRSVIPAKELSTVVDNIGLPVGGINMAYNNTGTIGPEDGDILISLSEDHQPTKMYIKKLREILPQQFPGMAFAFLPADIVSQILNFGSPAPVDVQVKGPNIEENLEFVKRIYPQLTHVKGLADVRIQQPHNYPQFDVLVNRTMAQNLGITEQNITNSVVDSLSGSFQINPTFWLNRKNGVSYPIVVQTPQYRLDTYSALINTPINSPDAKNFQVLGGLAEIKRNVTWGEVTHYGIQPSFDIYATPQNSDLGSIASEINRIIKQNNSYLPKGATIKLLGQVPLMNESFTGLLVGLAASILLIYLLIVVNFQSWLDPFVIITALPAALAGIVWMLFITHTPLSVPALTGAIMAMGTATANSILVVSFARERLLITKNSAKAAVEAGFARFRPVLMTALAMIIGMAPMALGLGDGGEQNAPLGRAVIGGLSIATMTTLLFVPVVFSMVHAKDRFESDDSVHL